MSSLEAPPVLYDRDDFIALRNKLRPHLWMLLPPIALVLLLICACILLLFYVTYGEVLWRETIVFFAAALLLVVTVWLLPKLTVAAQMRALNRNRLLVPQRFSIEEEGWRAESERGISLARWSAIQRIEMDGGRLFIFIAKTTAFVVPRRVFDSDEQFDAFAAAAQQRWREHHRL